MTKTQHHTRDERRQDMQAFLDTLTPVERHQMRWLLNRVVQVELDALIDWLEYEPTRMRTLHALCDWDKMNINERKQI